MKGWVLNWTSAMARMTKVMRKYVRMGEMLYPLSLVRLYAVLGTSWFKLIHFSPERKSREKRETISILIMRFTESSYSSFTSRTLRQMETYFLFLPISNFPNYFSFSQSMRK